MQKQVMAIAILALGGAASTVDARVVSFSGSISAINFAAGPVPPCGGPLGGHVQLWDGAGGVGQASGASNLGLFEPVQGHCVSAPVMGVRTLANGFFDWTFESGDQLEGTYSGLIYPTADPQVYNPIITVLVTGGTGKFSRASGTLDANALIYQYSTPFRTEWTMNGKLNLPAIPEPGSWALMLSGFAAAGVALRRRPMLKPA